MSDLPWKNYDLEDGCGMMWWQVEYNKILYEAQGVSCFSPEGKLAV